MKKKILLLIVLSLLLIIVGCRTHGPRPRPRPRWKKAPPRKVIIIKASERMVIIKKIYA